MYDGKVMFSQVCPHEGYPSPRFFPWSLVPGPFWGVPQFQPGVPQSQTGVTQSQLGATLFQTGVHQSRTGVPLSQPGIPPSWDWGTPWQGWGTPQDRRASTCYMTGDMPLAVTQEDFLVFTEILWRIKWITTGWMRLIKIFATWLGYQLLIKPFTMKILIKTNNNVYQILHNQNKMSYLNSVFLSNSSWCQREHAFKHTEGLRTHRSEPS